MRGRNARTFCFRKTSFVQSRTGTYYALLLRYFCLDCLPDIGHCVYWILAKIWDPNLSHTICNNFLSVTARPERKVRLCLKLFDFFPRWILIRLTWNLSRFVPNSVETLTWNFSKKIFWENFSEILLKTKAILYRNLWNFALLSAILFCVRIALKKFTEVLSYVVCT